MGKMLGLALVLVSTAEVWLVYLLAHVFSARAPGAASEAATIGALWLALLIANAAFLPLARRSLRSASGVIKHAARSWMIASIACLLGGILSLLAFVSFGAPAWGAEQLISTSTSMTSGDVAHGAALGGGVLGFTAIWWGYLVGQRWVHIEHVDLPIEKASAALSRLRIAHVTDIHIGPLLRAPRLAGLVRRINDTKPDVIVMTGDIFDFDPEYIDEGCAELAALSAPLGVYAVLGNHDVYTGCDAVAAGLKQVGVHVLRDAWTMVGDGDAGFCLVGAEDPGVGWQQRDAELPALDRLAREAPTDRPQLLLIHRPSYFSQAARLGFTAILAGHTHGGQLAPPFMREHNVSRMISRWTRGLYRSGESVMYVNPGLGVAGLPVRLNCPREIALVRMVGVESATTST